MSDNRQEPRKPGAKKRLGEVLHERGFVRQEQLLKAIADQHGKTIHLGELMLDRELVSKGDLASALEAVTNVPYIDCATIFPDPAVLRLVPRNVARRLVVLPLAKQGSKLVIVMAEPQNDEAVSELKSLTKMELSRRLSFRHDILAAIEKHYDNMESLGPGTEPEKEFTPSQILSAIEFVSTSSRQANREAILEVQAELMQKRTPAVQIVSEVLMAANEMKASDIHIEPHAAEVIIRLRVDGVLSDLRHEPRSVQNTLISRIKILSDMDIAERRIPQDGRFLVRLGAKKVDLRVSSLPTQYGEKIVIRLLDPDTAMLNFSQMNMPEAIERSLRQLLALPQGMILVTGPTGSGKSTTLYAALNLLRNPAVNIVTVEDPVEYVLEGINQVHVNNKSGLTFASCLRSILRQDPNIIMVGEIRDKETAEIALKAAQTGQLVLSTLHTNDSLSAVIRLLDLGVPGFLIASSVTAIVAQRLVRCLCKCRQSIAPTPEIAERLADLGQIAPVDRIYIPGSCEECNHTGYRGRIGVYEVLAMDETVREAIRTGEKIDSIRDLVREKGMKLMQQDALAKILSGVTSLEEVLRVVPVKAFRSRKCGRCGHKMGRTFRFCSQCGAEEHQPMPRGGEEGGFAVAELVRRDKFWEG